MKKLLLVINPVTAKTTIAPQLIDVINIFEKGGYDVTVHISKKKNDIRETFSALGSSYDVAVCAGGDGTLNEAVSGIINLKNKPKLGYIPSGTTNDFATSWGIPKRPVDAAHSIVKSDPVPTDVSLFCGRPFVYVAAFGAFTSVSYQTPQLLKQNLGYTAYIFEGIKSIPNIRPWRIRLEKEDGVITDQFLYGMISNTRRVGGFDLKMKTNISISDGFMEIILIKNPKNPADIAKMIGAVLSQDMTSEYIKFSHTKHIKFTSDEPMPWTVDGENGGTIKSGEVSILEHAIELFF